MLGLSILSLALMVMDHLSDNLDGVRSWISLVVTPIIIIADYPNKTAEAIEEVLSTREELQNRVDHLEQELLILHAKTEKMASLISDNNLLRGLLGSKEKLQDNVLVAELIGIDPNPRRHEIIIDKGSRHKVFVGQPVLDAHGLLGQVIKVSLLTSRILLISDQSHTIPVQVSRNNLRLVAQGSGTTGRLVLQHVQYTADIREGDLLVSSGLGDRFPVGYPVGVVDKVEHKPGKPFALATAIPSAQLDRSRHVLLVFTEERLSAATDSGNNEGG